MNIKKYFIPIIILLLLIQCKSEQKIDIYSSNFKEGWAGHPDSPNKKPFDYFYMKSEGRASNKAMKRKPDLMWQTTCIDQAVTKSKGELFRNLYYETIYLESACHDGEVNGPILVREILYKWRGLNVKQCKPLFEDQENFPYSGWNECECVVFVKIPGGEKTIQAEVKEVYDRFYKKTK